MFSRFQLRHGASAFLVFLAGCGGGGGGGSTPVTTTSGGTPPVTSPVTVPTDSTALAGFAGRVDNDPRPIANSVIDFYASASGTAPLTHAWSFGDGTTASTPFATHLYSGSGNYRATYKVTDGSGKSLQATLDVPLSPIKLQYMTGAVGGRGSNDGLGQLARFASPASVAVARDGSVYVADAGNNTIRKIAPNGQVVTWAGMPGVRGQIDGPGREARFGYSNNSGESIGVAVSNSGTVYVSDPGNRSIRKISPAGEVSTWVKPSSDEFFAPKAIAVAPDDTVYVLEGHALRKIVNGQPVTLAGAIKTPGFTNGDAAGVRFSNPVALTVDKDGNIYVRESCAGVRKVLPNGQTSVLYSANWSFVSPLTPTTDCGSGSITADASGQIYISVGTYIYRINPQGVMSVYSGNAFRPFGNVQDGDASLAYFFQADSLSMGADGQLFFTESREHTIRKIDTSGGVSTVAGLSQNARGLAANPDGVVPSNLSSLAVDADGYGYFSDGNSIVRTKFAQFPFTFAGNSSVPGYVDGPADKARFNNIRGVTLDKAGNLFVADSLNHLIRKITPDGVVSTYAGANSPGSADGTALLARFTYPRDLAMDPAGVLWVADSYGLRRISATGQVTTVAGASGVEKMIADTTAGVLFVSNQDLKRVAADGTVSTVTSFVTRPDKILARSPSGDLYVIHPGGDDDGRAEIRRIQSDGSLTTVASIRRFSSGVWSGQPAVEFTLNALPTGNQVSAASFLPNGNMMLIAGKTVFFVTGF